MNARATQPPKPPKPVPYAQAREHLQTGDLIALRSRKGLAAWLIRLITRSPYTHTGVAIWVGDRLLVVETRNGPASLVPLSQYQPHDFDVFDAPVEQKQRIFGRDIILKALGREIPYAYGDLVRIALHELLGVRLPKHAPDRLICSALSALIYQRLGWKPQGLPSIPTPRDLVNAIGRAPRMEVRRRG
jgi:hypothetical protein